MAMCPTLRQHQLLVEALIQSGALRKPDGQPEKKDDPKPSEGASVPEILLFAPLFLSGSDDGSSNDSPSSDRGSSSDSSGGSSGE